LLFTIQEPGKSETKELHLVKASLEREGGRGEGGVERDREKHSLEKDLAIITPWKIHS
jgi:hypothetical protein